MTRGVCQGSSVTEEQHRWARQAWRAWVIASLWLLAGCQEPEPPVITRPSPSPVLSPTPARPAGTPATERELVRRATPTAIRAPSADPCFAGRPSGTPPSPQCPVKGNIGATGERIYHLPGMRSYDRTAIDPARGERWFRDAEEAERAGWRRSQQ